MIEINLLPEELKKKKKVKAPKPEAGAAPSFSFSFKIQLLPTCLGVLGGILLLNFIVTLLTSMNVNSSYGMQDEWKGLKPQKEIIDRIKSKSMALKKRLNSIRRIAHPELEWTRLLSGLNQAVIPDVWLTSFKPTLAPQGTEGKTMPLSLSLEGYAVGKSETATSTVAKFINSLKNNKDFFGYFDDVELQDIRSSKISDQEAMKFKLVCKFKTKTPKSEASTKKKRKR